MAASRVTDRKTIRLSIGLIIAMGLLLTGCSEPDPGLLCAHNGIRGGNQAEMANDDSLALLHMNTMCDLVDRALFEENFHDKFPKTMGAMNGPGKQNFVMCRYMSETHLAGDMRKGAVVTTEASATCEGTTTVQDALEAYRTDLKGDIATWEPVEGLGLGAELINRRPGGSERGSILVTIVEMNEKLFEIVVRAEPDAEIGQLRPVAEALIPGVESVLLQQS